jgi:hypothetical protein
MEIAFNKKKLVKLIIGALLLTAGALWMLISQPQTSNAVFNNPLVKNGAAILGLLLGPVGFYIVIKKWRDKKPGLIIDDTGITDNSSGVSAGLIPWKDINEIRETKIFRQQFLMLIVQNPEEYINRQPNGLKRKGMESNYKHFGSPISISVNALDCKFYELKNMLQKRLADFREK